jgi:hypothetical protein
VAAKFQFRTPRHADVGREHGPGPVHALVQFICQPPDFHFFGLVLVEVSADEQYASDEQRRIDGRQLRIAVRRPVPKLTK